MEIKCIMAFAYEREIHNKTVGVAGKFGVKIASIPNYKERNKEKGDKKWRIYA